MEKKDTFKNIFTTLNPMNPITRTTLTALLSLSFSCSEKAQTAPAQKKIEQQTPFRPFSTLQDSEKRTTLLKLVHAFKDYTFPVPDATERAREDAFALGQSYYEFGSDRGSTAQHHKGVDIYGFGKTIVAFADGNVAELGRNVPHKSKTDHGNLVVLDHGTVNGHHFFTYYLHLGAIAYLHIGDHIHKGQALGRIDCIGIAGKKGLYNPGSSVCKLKAHNHFQIRVDGAHVNPVFFFPYAGYANYSELQEYGINVEAAASYTQRLSTLKGNKLSLTDKGKLNEDIRDLKGNERQGSFKKSVSE